MCKIFTNLCCFTLYAKFVFCYKEQKYSVWCFSNPCLCVVKYKKHKIYHLNCCFKIYIIYLAALGLSGSMWDQVPRPGIEPRLLHGDMESQSLDYQGNPRLNHF